LNQVNGLFDVMMGPVDVFEGAPLQALRERVVLLLSNVPMGLVDQLEGAVKAAGPIHSGIDRRMMVEVLAVVDGSLLDFVDGLVDFVNGFPFLLAEFPAIRALQMRSGVA
jgi:hypothetical protein